MRYERQAVLETGSSVPMAPAPAAGAATSDAAPIVPAPAKVPVAAAARPAVTKSTAKAKGPVHPVHHAAVHSGAAKKSSATRSDVATWVHPKTATTKHATVPADVSHQQYHPPQVVQP
jgi:hypothetical protein